MVRADEELVEVDDGARLWTATEGAGRPLVWCHGGPGGTDLLTPVAAMTTDITTVHRWEQRACGRSSGGPPFTMDRSVADLEALRRLWGHRRWVVAGQSFGAALALAYALAHPARTEAVVFVSCAVWLDGQPDWYEQFYRNRLDRLPEPQRERHRELRARRERQSAPDPDLVAELRQLSLRTEFADPASAPPEAMRELEAEMVAVNDEVNRVLGDDFKRFFARPAIRDRLASLEVPVLVVHGAADPRPVAAAEALAAVLPDSRLLVLDDVGHFAHVEAPDELRAALREFLGTIGDADRAGGPPDPGGPVDPDVDPQPVEDVDRPAFFTLMAAGWYPPAEAITQSYGFCFTADGLVILVEIHDGFWNLPGGQLEAGETARDALIREVAEEACARVIDCRYLASQHVWDPQAPDGRTSHYQTRWWARVALDPWQPDHETTRRLAVPPDRVLSTLSWRSTGIAERLLAAARAQEAAAADRR